MNTMLAEIEKHRDQFYRFVVRNVWDTSMADDVFASAVLAAFENRHKFTPGTNFRAWMFRILVNKCFVANREAKRAFEPLDEEAGEASATPTAGHGDLMEDPWVFMEQCGDEVYHALRKLSTAQRSCILLKDVERFSYQEIADVLGIPAATVMTHLARGRARLRQELVDYARRMGIIKSKPHVIALRRDEGATQHMKVGTP